MLSRHYKAALRLTHGEPSWGVGGHRWAKFIHDHYREHDLSTILDYGCGKGWLSYIMEGVYRVYVENYDPGIVCYSRTPEPADLVVCTDVLEHIEPAYLEDVLRHLQILTRHSIIFVVDTHKANRRLPDGSNAHKIVKPVEWWTEILSRNFAIESVSKKWRTYQRAHYRDGKRVILDRQTHDYLIVGGRR